MTRHKAMTTRTKLYIASLTSSIMMLLNAFSKPLYIPEEVKLGLSLGFFIPLALMFRYAKRLKQEHTITIQNETEINKVAINPKRKIRNRLLLIMALVVTVCLATPFWKPLTGTSLGMKGDLFVGMITAAIVCIIIGIRLRKV